MTSSSPPAPLQTDIIDRLPQGSRVLVIRLRALGDCVLSTPAIRLLKEYRPDLEIAVVAERKLADVFKGNPHISVILPPTLRAVWSFRPSLCINLHGGVRSVRLVVYSGARMRAGYDMLRFQWLYNTHIPTAQKIMGLQRMVHTAEHMASVMFYLGVPSSEIPGARLYPEPGRSEAAPGVPYAVIHPMASKPEKVWPARRFNDLAHSLQKDLGLEPVFIGSHADDLSAFRNWKTVQGLPLLEVARLMRGADLFVGNDSGPAHLAAAVNTPEVVLFSIRKYQIWIPWRTTAEVLKAEGPIDSITVDQVLQAAAKVRLEMRRQTHSTQ